MQNRLTLVLMSLLLSLCGQAAANELRLDNGAVGPLVVGPTISVENRVTNRTTPITEKRTRWTIGLIEVEPLPPDASPSEITSAARIMAIRAAASTLAPETYEMIDGWTKFRLGNIEGRLLPEASLDLDRGGIPEDFSVRLGFVLKF